MIRLSLREKLVNGLIRSLIKITCKLRTIGLQTISRTGPVILITNHTSNVEAAALYVLLQPRKATALGKIELWQKAITRFIMETWGIIPLRRGAVDAGAMRASIEALNDGSLVGIAPEGTRSKSGLLKRAHRGVAMLALRTGAPVYPTAQWGFREIGRNLKKLRRTPVTITAGRPFVVSLPEGEQSSPSVLRRASDEIMYQIAALLPEKFRGVYSDMSKLTTRYLHFLTPAAQEG